MDSNVQTALRRQPDYTDSFTQQVAVLANLLARSIGVPVYHDSDMNYNASQKLSIFLADNHRVCDRNAEHVTHEIAFLISSRGSFFTSVCLHRIAQNEWMGSGKCESNKQVQTIQEQVKTVLKREGLQPLYGGLLNELAEGQVTEMDGVPATVFQVLFSELY